jgi:hypothetical protein
MQKGILTESMKMQNGKAIYLDMCALRRPFDDQSILRNHIERVAVDLIESALLSGHYKMWRSPVHEMELNMVQDPYEHAELVMVLYGLGTSVAGHVDADRVRARAGKLVLRGFGTADAAHTAYAEACNVDFVTCDDELLSLCAQAKVSVWCGTPDSFCRKEGLQ